MSDELAQRAVACKGWRWMPGMLACLYREDGTLMGSNRHGNPGPDFLPDLSDPATRGCLLSLVREAWGDPHVCSGFRQFSLHPVVWVPSQDKHFSGTTEAEALIAALEAAP